jgi:signal transduction histidine kinase
MTEDALRRMAAELERQVGLTRTVLDSTIDGICLSDESGEMILANRPLIQFAIDLNLPLDGTVQERLLAVADRFTDPDRFRAAIGRITTELDEATLDEFTFADNGRCFQGFTTPVRDGDGRPIGRVWTLREVTRERVADRIKDEFIATVSHELRTPLTSIVGFLEMLLAEDAGPLSGEQRRFLEIVMRSSQRLMRQVGDLLFVSQLDSAGLALQPEDVDLSALVHEAVEQTAALVRQREIELSVEVPQSLKVECDRERIAQVVGNLLSNAVKFTLGGGTVAVRVHRDGDSAVVEVEDSGIGIPDAEHYRLFERFFRSSRATQQAIQGTGLGLAISHAIVEAHGGTIEAESAPAKGTLFRFTLPLRVPAELQR